MRTIEQIKNTTIDNSLSPQGSLGTGGGSYNNLLGLGMDTKRRRTIDNNENAEGRGQGSLLRQRRM